MTRDIIFLDIDGVIRTQEGDGVFDVPISVYERPFSRKSIAVLEEICHISKAQVVITSTWRIRFSLEELRERFRKENFNGKILDVTPVLPDQGRGTEIQTWLDHNEFEKFVIVDDCVNDILKHFDHEVVVQTDPKCGLNDLLAKERLEELLY
jgi:hypothetical protein